MSQDNEVCVKCGKPCGYDDAKGNWPERNKSLCGQCRGNLERRFVAFFGLEGYSSSSTGIEIEWPDVDKILSHIQREPARRVSYLVTDKKLYERTTTVKRPVEES